MHVAMGNTGDSAVDEKPLHYMKQRPPQLVQGPLKWTSLRAAWGRRQSVRLSLIRRCDRTACWRRHGLGAAVVENANRQGATRTGWGCKRGFLLFPPHLLGLARAKGAHAALTLTGAALAAGVGNVRGTAASGAVPLEMDIIQLRLEAHWVSRGTDRWVGSRQRNCKQTVQVTLTKLC